MSLLDQLSSAIGDKTQEANRQVVMLCLKHPASLTEVAAGLRNSQAALLGDCAEVFTKIAEERPDLVVPYVDDLVPLLTHKTTRVRWEAMHALALIASLIPDQITPRLHQFQTMLTADPSTIVRDYAIDAIGNYALAGVQPALLAYPLLTESLTLWSGKHRARALKGLRNIALTAPSLASDLRRIAETYLADSKAVAKKAAKELLKATDTLGRLHST